MSAWASWTPKASWTERERKRMGRMCVGWGIYSIWLIPSTPCGDAGVQAAVEH